MVVCGDDAGSMPKPHPHNALSICCALDVDPQVSESSGEVIVLSTFSFSEKKFSVNVLAFSLQGIE